MALVRALALAIVLLLALTGSASAQSALSGDDLIEKLSLQPLRSMAGELADLELNDPLKLSQYERIVQMRQRVPVLVRLGAVDDAGLAAIATALCNSPAPACIVATAHALRCLADRCELEESATDVQRDPLKPSTCRSSTPTTPKRSAPFGVGFSWGTGFHRSRYPNDGRAWSFGIEARLRLSNRFSTVARIDRIAGRDAATDADDNGSDDTWTGSITRIAALAGPSIVLQHALFDDTTRSLRLDLLGGYISTRSQADESGLAAGLDVSYQLSLLRVGVRFVQGFGDARDATTLLAHIGILSGARPPEPDEDDDCPPTMSRPRPRRPSSRIALGFEYEMLGWGLSSDHGLMATGIGLELAWYLTSRLDAIAHADLLLYPGYERERTIHQAGLAGLRLTHARRTDDDDTEFFTTAMGGYTHGAGIEPSTTGSGPIGDLAMGWGIQSPEGAANLRLHVRFGLSPDNVDYRAVFLSFGLELRFDPRSWGGSN